MAFSFGTTTTTPSSGAAPTPAAPAASSSSSSGGGFSFGGAASGSTAGGGGGFNFGGSAAASTSSSAAPSTSTGFSFGGATVAAPTTTTDASKSTAGGSGGGGFSFGAPALAATTTGGGGSSLFGGFTASAAGDTSSSTDATSNKKTSFSLSSTDGINSAASATAAVATPAAKPSSSSSIGGTTLFGANSTTTSSLTPGMTPAAKAPSPVKTPNTIGGGLDGAITPASLAKTTSASGEDATTTTTTAAAAAPSSTTTKMIEPPPIEYQSLSIEQILNRFQSELESDATSFMNEARRIAHYDTTLRSTQQSLSALTNDVSRLMLHQTELDATLQGVHSYQCELSTTLDTLERNVDELFASQVDVRVGDADIEREKGYEHAMDVDNRLDSIDATLRRVVNDLNAAQERVWSSLGSSGGIGGDSHDEVGKIIGVFNAHQETLACLEGKARDVESDLATIGRLLAKSG